MKTLKCLLLMMLLMMTFTPLLWAPDQDPDDVPEPSTLAVLLLTGAGAALFRKFKK
jgi:hypothetical protein